MCSTASTVLQCTIIGAGNARAIKFHICFPALFSSFERLAKAHVFKRVAQEFLVDKSSKYRG